MRKFIRAIVLTIVLALPAFFASKAFATNESCGTCMVGNAPNTSVHLGVNEIKMACSNCHTPRTTTGGSTIGSTLTVKATAESCGACAVGTAPKGVPAHKNVTATTLCSVCHITTTAGRSPPGGTVGIYPTTHSCDRCTVGTAPKSVSAHKNVNENKTACSVCHISSSPTGSHIDDDHGVPGSNTGSRHDDDDHRQISPGNSDFGHSHKHDKQPHDNRRDHDD